MICGIVVACGREPGHGDGHGEWRPKIPTRAMPHLRGELLGMPLTHRDIEILEWYAKLGDQQAVADTFGLAIGTVKNHLTLVYAKLGVGSFLEAMTIMGWLAIPTAAERAAYDAAASFAALQDELSALIERSREFTGELEASLAESAQDAPA